MWFGHLHVFVDLMLLHFMPMWHKEEQPGCLQANLVTPLPMVLLHMWHLPRCFGVWVGHFHSRVTVPQHSSLLWQAAEHPGVEQDARYVSASMTLPQVEQTDVSEAGVVGPGFSSMSPAIISVRRSKGLMSPSGSVASLTD